MKRIKSILFCLLAASSIISLDAQQNFVDSLLNVYQKNKTNCSPCLADTATIKLLDDISWELLSRGDYDSSIKYATRAINLADTLLETQNTTKRQKRFLKLYKAALFNTIGIVYNYQGNFLKALNFHE